MPKKEKALLGIAGVAGVSWTVWQVLFPWIQYDLQFLKLKKRTMQLVKAEIMAQKYVIEMFEEVVKQYPYKPFIIFEAKIYTYAFMDEQANRVANVLLKSGHGTLDTVGILVYNSPELIWTMLGLQKLGIAVAFLNYNLWNQSLRHVIRISEAKALIIGKGERLLEAVSEIKDDLGNIPLYVQGLPQSQLLPGYQSWDDLMFTSLPVPVCKIVRDKVQLTTPYGYIFTSGTTGMPKPVIVNQMKAILSCSFLNMIQFCHNDIIYTTTPLYHSVALMALNATIHSGATMVLKDKFSAHQYWEDCRRYKVTVAQYIGEICRYILSVPKSTLDGVHNVRVAVGNGLRKDIWAEFQNRFRVPQIAEFFGATEGPVSMFNIHNKLGSCGRISPFLEFFDAIPKYLVKYDPETEEPVRDKHGHCIKIKPGESGLLITPIIGDVDKVQFYKGSREINMEKLIFNVFKEGDYYFNFGDLLYMDKEYFVYFADRIGDTFRWKGENVATIEVANILTELEFVDDANVYGVHLPGTEGRAGMAAIQLKDDHRVTPSTLQAIYNKCEHGLPGYARPIFLRFPENLDLTSTFKVKKNKFVKEGFDPNKVTDHLFYKDDAQKSFLPLTTLNIAQFMSKARL